ncbi:MAG TPA: Fic family protein [Campylobacterales bacterium]|nr:Fic family protein [Campylobacterales bacterium]
MKTNYYTQPPTKTLEALFQKADTLKTQIDKQKNKNSNLWATILQKLKVDWTYNSNSIEGSTLSRGDTHFFLTEGLTVEGKPFKDFLDAKNHLEAIDYLYEIVSSQRNISEGLIKELNALILAGVSYTKAQDAEGNPVRKKATAGEYKKQPNHVLLASGEIHRYVEPIHVQSQMQELVEWIECSKETLHPILVASIVHYNLVRIHAFDDGNGRGARILMNLILMNRGFFPAVVRTEKKRKYLSALHEADDGDIEPFISFVALELIETLESVLGDLGIDD